MCIVTAGPMATSSTRSRSIVWRAHDVDVAVEGDVAGTDEGVVEPLDLGRARHAGANPPGPGPVAVAR